MAEPDYDICDLLRVMERLRDPQRGCPWDLKQNFRSIVPSTLEECYELADAIEQGDYPHLAEELGDVLFQVIFYAQLGAEQHLFDFSDVVNGLVGKLLRRHPHVFANTEIEGVVNADIAAEEVNKQWESIKQTERVARAEHGLLADIPKALPALPRAQKLQNRAARVNFDWPETSDVLTRLDEELVELRLAMAADDPLQIEDELGDVLFTCVNLARHLKVDAETALRRASSKFETRFGIMEKMAASEGTGLAALSGEALEQLWQKAKKNGG